MLADDLHLCYLITPLAGGVEPNWKLYLFFSSAPIQSGVFMHLVSACLCALVFDAY